MTGRLDVMTSSLDEYGLEVPFAAGLDAGELLDAGVSLGEFGESPFAESAEAGWFESPPGELFESGEAFDEGLFEAETESDPGVVRFVAGPTLRRGSSGAGVSMLQHCLAKLGIDVAVNGQYGAATQAAVRAFQSRFGLTTDGVAGPRTRAAIAAALRGPVAPAPSSSQPATLPANGNRIVVDSHPLIRSHRGTAPDLILKWNRIDGDTIDVVVHFHGYSGKAERMRIDSDKENRSGLDFSDPAGSGTPGRDRPTLAVLPRGNYFGGKSGAGYDFPNLIKPGALQQLIDDALARLGQETGRSISMKRFVVTGHSGGGAPVNAILAHMDPDEVYIFDGMYGSGDNVERWAKRRIAREIASPGAVPPALRVLYRQGSAKNPGTQPNSEAMARALRGPLTATAAASLRSFVRIDKTSVEHNDIPGRFGWLLLANAGADLPGVRTYGAPAVSHETYQERESYGGWQSAPTLREESEQEAIGSYDQLFEPAQKHGMYERSDANESLAWLDVEAPGGEAEQFESSMAEGFDTESLESLEWFEPQQSESTEYEQGETSYAGEDWHEMETNEEAGELQRFGDFEDERDAEWESSEFESEFEDDGLKASGLTPAEKKAVEITSTFETGKRGGFYGLSGNFDGQGLSFGLVNWTIGTGSLQPLLRDFITEQPQRWGAIFGPDAERFRQLMARKDKAAVKDQHRFAVEQMNSCSIVKGKRKWAIREPWVGYFKQLSEDPEFQKIQIRYVRNLLARGDYYCRYFKLTSERSFAFMFDAVSSHGKWWLTKKFAGQEKRRILIEARIKLLVDQHGQGAIPESEILLAIADVLGATSAPRWAANVRIRKRWFVTGEHPRARELKGLDPSPDIPYSASGAAPVTPVAPATPATPAAPAAPSPSVQPQTTSDVCTQIAQVAEQEFQRWHPPGGNIHERDKAAVPILQQYYRDGVHATVSAADLQSEAWQKAHPWSSVFISWVMRTAGAGSGFAYSAAHRVYIAAARKNRLNSVTSSPFWAYRVSEVAPQVGDIICKARSGSGATYDNIGDGKGYATHGDIVTEVHSGSLRVIGGNVNQNVDSKSIKTLTDGRLSLEGKQSMYFAVVRCRGSAGGPAAPIPAPQGPSSPTPGGKQVTPGPAPGGKKLTSSQFVATFSAAARASEAKHRVPALVTLGQAALESGWGAHAPRFNFFGIKAKASDPESTRQLLKTREVFSDPNHKFPKVISVTPRQDGKYDYVVCDWFRAYSDAAAAFDAHGEFLVRNKRYAKAFTVTNDPYAFATEVARAGYATDPSYARILSDVMRMIERAGGP